MSRAPTLTAAAGDAWLSCASFVPPPAKAPASDDGSGSDARRSHGGSHHHHHHRHHRHSHHHRHRHREKSRGASPARADARDGPPPAKVPAMSLRKGSSGGVEEAPRQPFYYDRRVDPSVLEYGRLYSGDVPRFNLPRGGVVCVGLSERTVVKQVRVRGTTLTVITHGRQIEEGSVPSQRYWNRKLPLKAMRVRPLSSRCLAAPDAHFVPLCTNQEREAEREGESVAMKERAAALNRRNAQCPDDVLSWLENVDFQETLFSSLPGSVARRVVLSKQLSMLREALRHNPRDERLVLRFVGLCDELWEPKKVSEMWDRVLLAAESPVQPEFPSPVLSSGLWEAILMHTLSDTSLSVSSVRKLFFRFINAVASQTNKGVLREYVANELLVRVFADAVAFEVSTGHVERAMGMWQSVVEFNLLGTSVPRSSFASRREDFLAFWASEEPRIGECDSRGWSRWLSKGSQQVSASTAERFEVETWLPTAEAVEEAANKLLESLHTEMESVEEQDTTLTFAAETSEEESDAEEEEEASCDRESTAMPVVMPADDRWKHEKREACREGTAVEWAAEELRRKQGRWKCLKAKEVPQGDAIDPDAIVLPEDVGDWLFELTSPSGRVALVLAFVEFLGSDRCSHCSSFWSQTALTSLELDKDNATEMLCFCKNATLALAEAFPQELAVLKATLSWQLSFGGQDGVMRILALRRNDSDLWTWYASQLHALGRTEEALRVFRTLRASGVMTLAQTLEAAYHMSLSLAASDSTIRDAVLGLMSACSSQAVTETSESELSCARNALLSILTSDREAFVPAASCLGLLECLVSGQEPMLRVFQSALKLCLVGDRERLMERWVRLCEWCHARHPSLLSPRALADMALSSLVEFPDNPVLLSLGLGKALLTSEGRLPVTLLSRLIKLLGQRPDSLYLLLAVVRAQRTNPVAASELIETALSSGIRSLALSPVLWLNLLATSPSSPKNVFLRAIRHVPWSLDLWLLSLSNSSICSSIPQQDLDAIIDLARSKELRLPNSRAVN